MNTKNICCYSLIGLMISLMTGCVVGRRTFDLAVPDSTSGQSNGISVAIQEPVDNRFFENNPDNPSTPSIDGDVRTMPPDLQALMIGRQRNTYGMAMGDIALPDTTSVNEKVRLLVTEAMQEEGYQINDTKRTDYDVEILIDQFWGWFTPGMFSVSFEAKIASNITIKGQGTEKSIYVIGYGETQSLSVSDAYWQSAYKKAFDDYMNNLRKELSNLNLKRPATTTL